MGSGGGVLFWAWTSLNENAPVPRTYQRAVGGEEVRSAHWGPSFEAGAREERRRSNRTARNGNGAPCEWVDGSDGMRLPMGPRASVRKGALVGELANNSGRPMPGPEVERYEENHRGYEAGLDLYLFNTYMEEKGGTGKRLKTC